MPAISRGDVVLIKFPFTNLSSHKLRPAIVISPTPSRGRDLHFIFAGTSAKLAGEPGVIKVTEDSPEAAQMGLRFPPGVTDAYIVPNKIMTLETSLVSRRLGTVPPAMMTQIESALRAALGL